MIFNGSRFIKWILFGSWHHIRSSTLSLFLFPFQSLSPMQYPSTLPVPHISPLPCLFPLFTVNLVGVGQLTTAPSLQTFPLQTCPTSKPHLSAVCVFSKLAPALCKCSFSMCDPEKFTPQCFCPKWMEWKLFQLIAARLNFIYNRPAELNCTRCGSYKWDIVSPPPACIKVYTFLEKWNHICIRLLDSYDMHEKMSVVRETHYHQHE